MVSNNVTKCVCHNRGFQEIKHYAARNNLNSLEELRDLDFCSNSCGLCAPYVELVLKIGQTVFAAGEPYHKKR